MGRCALCGPRSQPGSKRDHPVVLPRPPAGPGKPRSSSSPARTRHNRLDARTPRPGRPHITEPPGWWAWPAWQPPRHAVSTSTRQKHRNAACVKWGVAPVDGSGPLAGSPKGAERLAASRYGRVGAGPHLLGIFSWRVTIFSVRDCAECGQQLPRSLPGAGRPLAYCSPACRQRAYRGRGGQGSGTTGAERRRRERGASGRPAAPA